MLIAGNWKMHKGTEETAAFCRDLRGADWHPSLKTHAKMAQRLIETIEHDLTWEPVVDH